MEVAFDPCENGIPNFQATLTKATKKDSEIQKIAFMSTWLLLPILHK